MIDHVDSEKQLYSRGLNYINEVKRLSGFIRFKDSFSYIHTDLKQLHYSLVTVDLVFVLRPH